MNAVLLPFCYIPLYNFTSIMHCVSEKLDKGEGTSNQKWVVIKRQGQENEVVCIYKLPKTQFKVVKNITKFIILLGIDFYPVSA